MSVMPFHLRRTPLLLALLLPGCGGVKNYANDNDRLRAENLDLRDKVESLFNDLAATKKALEIEQRRTAAKLPEGFTRPIASRFEIGGLSGSIDTNEDGVQDAVRLYLRTYEPSGKFIPMLASMDVSLVYIPPGQPAVTVATVTFDPQQFNDGYRTGLTGTHYTLVVPLAKPPPPGVTQLTARVKLTDAASGVILEAERTVRWGALK
jgi:hypothetical protein